MAPFIVEGSLLCFILRWPNEVFGRDVSVRGVKMLYRIVVVSSFPHIAKSVSFHGHGEEGVSKVFVELATLVYSRVAVSRVLDDLTRLTFVCVFFPDVFGGVLIQ